YRKEVAAARAGVTGPFTMSRSKRLFKRIDVWAVNYFGEPAKPGAARSRYENEPFRLYPAGFGYERFHAVERKQALLEHIKQAAASAEPYTHIFILADHFILAADGLMEALFELTRRHGI